MTVTVKEFFEAKYGGNKKSFKELSRISAEPNETFLVQNTELAYSLDDICTGIFGVDKPMSVDAAVPFDDRLVLIEFKSGFKDTIDKNTFKKSRLTSETTCDESGVTTPSSPYICNKLKYNYRDGMNNHFKYRSKCKDVLINSLRIKLYDTLLFLQTQVFPNCSQKRNNIKLDYIVIADSDYIRHKLTTITEVDINGNVKTCENVLIETKLKHLTKICNADGPLCDKAAAYRADKFDELAANNFDI